MINKEDLDNLEFDTIIRGKESGMILRRDNGFWIGTNSVQLLSEHLSFYDTGYEVLEKKA